MKKKNKRKRVTRPRGDVAARSLAKMEKTIAPYVITRKSRVFSTAGKWREESNVTTDF
jgi:hypothetical protein